MKNMVPRMKEVGRKVGIEFSYGGNIGNTFDSHRLIRDALRRGGASLQNEVVEELMHAYFEEEKCLSSSDVLQSCATKAGIDAESIINDPDFLAEEVRAEISHFSVMAQGVPFFIINNKFSFSGAQPPDVLLDMFARITDREADRHA